MRTFWEKVLKMTYSSFFFLGSSESPATALQKKCAQGDSPGVPPRFSQGNLTAMALTIPPGISTGTPPEFFQ